MSTAGELVARCQVRSGDLNGRDTSPASWLTLINEAYSELWAAADWPFKETVEVAQTVTPPSHTLAMPADVEGVRAVFNSTDGLVLNEIEGQAPYQMFPTLGADTAVPEFYRVYGGFIELWPYPAVTTKLTVEYQKPPAALDTGDSPAFPARYHHLLYYWAMGQVALDGQKTIPISRRYQTASGLYTGQFTAGIQAMKADLLSARGAHFAGIPDNFFD